MRTHERIRTENGTQIVDYPEEYLRVGQPFELKVTQGLIPFHSKVDKFGINPTITTTSTPEDIWEFGGVYIYDANGTAPIVSLVSDEAADTQPVVVVGLDINGDIVSQEITLTGTTRVALDTPLWRVFRMYNNGTVNFAGTIYCYIGTGNVPAANQVRAIIDDGNNQTLMAVYTIPNKYVGFLYRGELGVELDGNAAALAEYAHCHYESRAYGKVFRIKKAVTVMVSNPVYQDYRSFPDVIPSLTDIKLSVEKVTQTMGIWGTFDILLVDEELFSDEYLAAIGQVGY